MTSLKSTYLKLSFTLLLLSLLTTQFAFSQFDPHLDGAFSTADFTWAGDDEADLDIVFRYNPANAPSGTPSVSSILSYANTAFDKWNNATSHTKSG